MTNTKNSFLNFLSLFTSMSTLICCALPALLVSLGLGAVLAGLASQFPALIWISEHKLQVFIISGVMLSLNGTILWLNRNAPCPVDPKLRDACINGRSMSKKLLLFSTVIFFIGLFFAYIAPSL